MPVRRFGTRSRAEPSAPPIHQMLGAPLGLHNARDLTALWGPPPRYSQATGSREDQSQRNATHNHTRLPLATFHQRTRAHCNNNNINNNDRNYRRINQNHSIRHPATCLTSYSSNSTLQENSLRNTEPFHNDATSSVTPGEDQQPGNTEREVNVTSAIHHEKEKKKKGSKIKKSLLKAAFFVIQIID